MVGSVEEEGEEKNKTSIPAEEMLKHTHFSKVILIYRNTSMYFNTGYSEYFLILYIAKTE